MNQDVNVYQAALLTSSVTDAAVKWKTPNKFFTPIIIIFTHLLFRFHTYCFIFTPIVLISHLYCFVFTPIERFNQSKFVAVIVNGSMDSSIVDNEIVFMQTCISGEIQTDFLRCCHVQRGNAAGIMKAIERAANKVALWDEFCTKLVALGSDGASVMLGKKNGVIALLQ